MHCRISILIVLTIFHVLLSACRIHSYSTIHWFYPGEPLFDNTRYSILTQSWIPSIKETKIGHRVRVKFFGHVCLFFNLSFFHFFNYLESVALWCARSLATIQLIAQLLPTVISYCSKFITNHSNMKFLFVLVVVFAVVSPFTSDALPAAPLNEDVVLTTLTESTSVMQEQQIFRPTRRPSKAPRVKPTRKPTRMPSVVPSVLPTMQPTFIVEVQGPFSVGGDKVTYPINLPASEQPTVLPDVQPPHGGSWWIYLPFLAPSVWDHLQ